MIPRKAKNRLNLLANEYPVVILTGPRHSGKTILVRHVFREMPYVSMENPDYQELAEVDPRSFLEKYSKGAVFDEVQRVPSLFSYLQEIVDSDPTPGRFILTGSQQFNLLSGITQSLAELLPFSMH